MLSMAHQNTLYLQTRCCPRMKSSAGQVQIDDRECSRHVLVLVPLLFGSCVQSHLAATCARGAVVRIWLDLQRNTGLTRAVVYRLSISYALIRTSDTETSIRAISKFWSAGAGRVLHFLVPKNEVCISSFATSTHFLFFCFLF